MMSARAARTRLLLVMAFLLTLHFYVRPRLLDVRQAPHFQQIAQQVYSNRSRPGNAANAGFLVGIIGVAQVPAR
ncbi:MAG: hypothetical protein AB7I33_16960, partial [Gemmatimonadales bacterium]